MGEIRAMDPDFVRHRFEVLLSSGGLQLVTEAVGEPITFLSAESLGRPPEALCPKEPLETVTENNLREYLPLALEHYVAGGMREQLQALLEGFWDVVPLAVLGES